LRNQIFDSNGPDMRVRGNAFQVHEKYQALAKDALSSGDRVLAENYLQHAEHYFRIIEAINEATAAEQRARQASWEGQPQPNMQSGPVQYGDGNQPQMVSEGRMEQNPVQDLTQQGHGNHGGGQHQEGNQDGQYQANQHGNQGHGNQGGGQQNFRRNNNRDNNNRDGNRENYGDRNQQRYDNRGNTRQGYDQNQGQQNQAEYQPQNQTQNPAQGQQSQDPLYDGVDEDVNDSPDTQAAIGGRR
jgi:hypothetical protein